MIAKSEKMPPKMSIALINSAKPLAIQNNM